jgi:hypothetical protein
MAIHSKQEPGAFFRISLFAVGVDFGGDALRYFQHTHGLPHSLLSLKYL